MKVRYLKSSTVVVETNGLKILTDPWLTDGEYYGSWYHYPKFEINEVYFEDIDFIYVSHIHMDHFSKATFKLLNKSIPVLVHSYANKFLKANIERLGFDVIELEHNKRTHLKNGVYINILAADNCNPELCQRFFGCAFMESKFGSTQIDTLCVIDDGIYSVLNTNDCPFELAKNVLPMVLSEYKTIDFLLVGYAGAGPFPQCFVMEENEKIKQAELKRLNFLKQGINFLNVVRPKYFMPFAGTYVLGGKFYSLQNYRGVPEIEDAVTYFLENMSIPIKPILLNTYEYFDLINETSSKEYIPQNQLEKKNYIENVLSQKLMDYEMEDMPKIDELIFMLESSYQRFEVKRKEIGFSSETVVLIYLENDKYFLIPMNGKLTQIIKKNNLVNLDNYVIYSLDLRLLKWILKGPRFAHWNNAEVGSHITFERKPNIFERGLYHAMCFFHM